MEGNDAFAHGGWVDDDQEADEDFEFDDAGAPVAEIPGSLCVPLFYFEIEALPPARFWMLGLLPGTDCSGLAELEAEIVRDLTLEAEASWPGCSMVYESKADCRRAAIEMMRRRPGLPVLVQSNDGFCYFPCPREIVPEG